MDAGAPVGESLPFWDEWKALEPRWKDAAPLADGYPGDPGQPVLVDSGKSRVTTTAFGAAILRGNRGQVDAYLASGADITAPIWKIREGNDFTFRSFPAFEAVLAVLDRAAETEFLTYLLARGADADAMWTMYSKDGYSHWSLLHELVLSENASLLEAVLKHGVADVNRGHEHAKGASSPLCRAVLRDNVEAVKLLLEYGVDPNVGYTAKVATGRGSRSRSPLSFAQQFLQRHRRETSEEIVRLLREHGAE